MTAGTNKPRLVIVGGDYLCSDLAKSLVAAMEITLIARATHFTHEPAMIRAVVDPPIATGSRLDPI